MAFEKLDTKIRREQIAEVAATLLAEQGLKGLNMAAVAKRVGIVTSAIYRHFRTRDEVVFAALDITTDRLIGSVSAVCEETTDPIERLRLLLMRQADMIVQNKAYPRVFSADEIFRGHPERRQKLYDSLTKYVAKISSVIHQGQLDGQIRTDVDAWTLALMFVGLWRGALPFWYHSSGNFSLTKHLEKAWKIFSESLKAG